MLQSNLANTVSSSVFELIKISSQEELSKHYKQIESYLDLSLTKAPEYNRVDILRNILTGINVLWIPTVDNIPKGIVTTEIVKFPNVSKLGIHLCGGEDIEEWVDESIFQLEEYAKSMELDEIEIHGRKGWAKLLPDYTTDRVIFNKRITQ